MRQLVLTFLCVLLAVVQAKAVIASGDGWTLDDDGTLTVEKNIEYDYESRYPWYSNSSSIKKVVFTSGTTSIGNYAFWCCSGLESVEIPSSVTRINASAFWGCSGLTSVTIPSSVTSIGDGAFSYCNGLTSIKVDKNNKKYDSRDNCNALIETARNTLIAGCKNTTIPSSVTLIGAQAFCDCSGLTGDLKIPEGVTAIGDDAFSGCSGLTSVEIPSGVTSIGSSAFSYCSGLTSVEIPSGVTSIGSSAFSYCSGLESVEIPSSVTSIGESAFSSCSGLTSVEIPSSVTSIGRFAFESCSGLTSVEIPSSVTSIGNQAFYGCSGLTSVEIPSSVTSIGNGAFYGCSGLESVEIPSSVTSIGRFAFESCSGLKSVVSLSKEPQVLGSNAFCDVDLSKVTLYVPKDAVEAYKAADVWMDFGKIVGMEEDDLDVFGSLSIEFDADCVEVEVVSYADGTLTLSIRVKEGYDFESIYVNEVKVLGPKGNKAASVEAWWNEDGTVSISGLTEKSVVSIRVSGEPSPAAVREMRVETRENWYEMSGRKLAGKPTRNGVYVHNGKLEMVK